MRKYSYIFIFTWAIISCAPEKTTPPANLLTQSQMSGIISDMHIADAIVNDQDIYTDSANREAVTYREMILKKHHTSKEQFVQSLEFYKQNPDLMDSVYAEVITKLSSTESMYRGK